MKQIKDGDVVVLKSGGPKMSVTNIKPITEIAECCWFDGGIYLNASFPTVCLKPAKS